MSNFWKYLAMAALAALWLTTAGIAGNLNEKLGTANRAATDAELQRERLAVALDSVSASAQEGLKQVDSLKLALKRVPKVRRVVFHETVVDSADLTSVTAALVERTAQRDSAVATADSAIAVAEDLSQIAESAVSAFEEHLVADTAAFAVMKAETDSLKQSIALIKRATHRPWYKKVGTRLKEAAVIGFTFWLGSKS